MTTDSRMVGYEHQVTLTGADGRMVRATGLTETEAGQAAVGQLRRSLEALPPTCQRCGAPARSDLRYVTRNGVGRGYLLRLVCQADGCDWSRVL